MKPQCLLLAPFLSALLLMLPMLLNVPQGVIAFSSGSTFITPCRRRLPVGRTPTETNTNTNTCTNGNNHHFHHYYHTSSQLKASLLLLPGPRRLFKWSLLALLLSEGLDRSGALEHPHMIQDTILQLWRKSTSADYWKHGIQQCKIALEQAVSHPPRETLAMMIPKHQWMVGLLVGLVLSNILYTTVVPIVIGSGVAVYALSELQQSTATSAEWKGVWSPSIQQKLQKVRNHVRATFQDPKHAWQSIIAQTLLPRIPAPTKWGFVAGAVLGIFV